MIEMKDGYKEYTRKSNGKIIKYILNAEDKPVAKSCTKCGKLLMLESYTKKAENSFDGKRADCRFCIKIYRQENREREAVYRKGYRQENREREAEYKRGWKRSNPELVRLERQRRTARERSLPDTLSREQDALILDIQEHKCILSGATYEHLHTEHFIPISWGAGGTTFENCYYMDGSLNLSKGNKNPFEWIKRQPEAYQERFHGVLVPMLAERNGMTVQAFTSYVYECEKAYLNSKQQALV